MVIGIELLIIFTSKIRRNGQELFKWQPIKCKHAGVCVKMLPNVYKPKSTPWITMENASTEALKAQVSACPSGALCYSVD